MSGRRDSASPRQYNRHSSRHSHSNGSANGSYSKRRSKLEQKKETANYSSARGRLKPAGYWQPKGREEEERQARDLKALKARKDAFVAEDIEAELNTFKKGTYMFDAKAEAPKKAASPKSAKPNGHSKFLLKRANTKHPPPPTSVDDQRQVLMQRHRMANGHRPSRTGGSRDDDVKLDREEKRPKKSRSSSRKTKQSVVPTVAVTVSPSRNNQYGAYGAVPDYFQGPGHGPPPTYGGYAAPHTYAYGPPPPGWSGYGNGTEQLRQWNGYGGPPPQDFDPMAPPPGYHHPDPMFYGQAAAPGAMMEDGTWYPYGQPAPVDGYIAHSTPKKPRKSASVDLTSPSKAIANGDVVDRPMSPGRRVNKIQKQLEFYFSVDNMMVDKFLQKCMDGHGWVKIQDILGFKRLKGLRATKELVTEAAFHSTLIEVEHKSGGGSSDRIRMNKLWKQFVPKQDTKKKASSSSSRTKLREKDLQKQKELDAADLNNDTIEAIVAAIEKKQESRERRRRERARQKEKARLAKEKEMEDTASPKDDGSEPNDDDTKTPHELIIKDQQQGDDDTGDPDGNDMDIID